MKRIDLHIHTVPTEWDLDFHFDFEQLRQHVVDWHLDAIAITNHNVFDFGQYEDIRLRLAGTCAVLPGVEASALGTHLLLICSSDMAPQLSSMCVTLKSCLSDTSDTASFDELVSAFPNLDEFIVIPHFQKDPAISEESYELIADYICACETSSLKKALRLNKTKPKHRPFVYFTDYRFGSESIDGKRSAYKPGGAYIKASSCSFDAIRRALRNDQVALACDGSDSFELYPGITSTEGINLILGRRSTGKTYTLNRVFSLCDEDDVYYIKQGDLVSKSKEDSFYADLNNQFAATRNRYMTRIGELADELRDVGSDKEQLLSIKTYLNKLKKHADTKTQNDSYSSAPLFKREILDKEDCSDGHSVIEAVITILNATRYSEVLDKTVGRKGLIDFLQLVVEDTRTREIQNSAVRATNVATNAVQVKLNRSSVDPYPDPILPSIFKHEAFLDAFCKLVQLCWNERIVSNDQGAHFLKYSVVAERKRFTSATEVKKAMGLPPAVSLDGITKKLPREYVNMLLDLTPTPLITNGLFDLQISVRDKRGSIPSGGQRTECVFLGKLSEAGGKRVVLIDEPESSFDNPFLDEDIATKIRQLGKSSTVFVTTHNQVLGFGLKPNKVFLTSFNEETKKYEIHCGDMGDSELCCSESPNIPTIDSIINILEASRPSYEARHDYYEGSMS
jgi:hypothetical protein